MLKYNYNDGELPLLKFMTNFNNQDTWVSAKGETDNT